MGSFTSPVRLNPRKERLRCMLQPWSVSQFCKLLEEFPCLLDCVLTIYTNRDWLEGSPCLLGCVLTIHTQRELLEGSPYLLGCVLTIHTHRD